ncbi:MAG: hypothetical protein RBS39_06515 [Phycisphaerales bacterium]|nr:hypothetical protein [Phycisphaerales bacterium]
MGAKKSPDGSSRERVATPDEIRMVVERIASEPDVLGDAIFQDRSDYASRWGLIREGFPSWAQEALESPDGWVRRAAFNKNQTAALNHYFRKCDLPMRIERMGKKGRRGETVNGERERLLTTIPSPATAPRRDQSLLTDSQEAVASRLYKHLCESTQPACLIGPPCSGKTTIIESVAKLVKSSGGRRAIHVRNPGDDLLMALAASIVAGGGAKRQSQLDVLEWLSKHHACLILDYSSRPNASHARVISLIRLACPRVPMVISSVEAPVNVPFEKYDVPHRDLTDSELQSPASLRGSEEWQFITRWIGSARADEMLSPKHFLALTSLLRRCRGGIAWIAWVARELSTRTPEQIATHFDLDREIGPDELWDLRAQGARERIDPEILELLPFLPNPFAPGDLARHGGVADSRARAVADQLVASGVALPSGDALIVPRQVRDFIARARTPRMSLLADSTLREVVEAYEHQDASLDDTTVDRVRTSIEIVDALSTHVIGVLGKMVRRGAGDHRLRWSGVLAVAKAVWNRCEDEKQRGAAAELCRMAGVARHYCGDADAAQHWLRELRGCAVSKVDDANAHNLDAALLLARDQIKRHDVDTAIVMYQRAITLMQDVCAEERAETPSNEHDRVLTLKMNLAQMYESLGDLSRARRELAIEVPAKQEYLAMQRAKVQAMIAMRERKLEEARIWLRTLSPDFVDGEECRFTTLLLLAWFVACKHGRYPPTSRFHGVDTPPLAPSEFDGRTAALALLWGNASTRAYTFIERADLKHLLDATPVPPLDLERFVTSLLPSKEFERVVGTDHQ